MHIFDITALLVFVSGLFVFINTFYMKLPPALGLMILTLLWSIVVLFVGEFVPALDIATQVKGFDFREVLNQLVISIILFAGGLNMDIRKLGKQRWPVIIMSMSGAILSTFVIGTILFYALNFLNIHVSYLYCLIFGAVISSTDPMSSTDTIKRFAVPKVLQTKIEGESLFTGAFSVVLTFVLYHLAIVTEGHALTIMDVSKIMLLEIAGGIVLGLIMGYAGHYALKYIDNKDVHVEILITIALVMVGSFISEYLMIYSKLVALIMGLLIGNMSREASNDGVSSVGSYVYKFWGLMEQTVAVMLFVLMGLEMLVIDWRVDYFAAGFLAVNVVLFGRWLSIYIPVKLMSNSMNFDKNTISVMTWGAFRGGLPIVLILALQHFPGKELLITMTYVVVVCSILFQGFTLPIMMKEKFLERSKLDEEQA